MPIEITVPAIAEHVSSNRLSERQLRSGIIRTDTEAVRQSILVRGELGDRQQT